MANKDISNINLECGKCFWWNFVRMVQAKIPSRFGAYFNGEWQKYTPLCPTLSKHEGLKGIGHSTSIRNLTFGVNSVTVSYLISYDSLLQNAKDIIKKCDSYFITKCDSYHKLWRFYYKMRQLLQNATFITNCDSTHIILPNY